MVSVKSRRYIYPTLFTSLLCHDPSYLVDRKNIVDKQKFGDDFTTTQHIFKNIFYE